MAGLWYRTGSVAVTQSSKKITGTGTSWLTALNRPSKGNVFYGPDGKAYEIDYVSSETELYLVDVYTGANASSQGYKIDVRGGTVPELSRQLSEHYAYMQGIIDSLQSIVSGSGDVTITGPNGQTATVPALSNMLSKSGNLAGLADKPTARNNLGLGDAATKGVGTGAGAVAAGDHEHTQTIIVAGDPSTYYPVRLIGAAIRHGIGISREVHRDGTWAGSLRMHIIGAGAALGGDYPFLDYEFTQLWTAGDKGVLADVAVATDAEGIYVWLRGGRSYSVTGVGLAVTVYLNGVTEGNGTVFPPKLTGPLSMYGMASSLDGPQLFRGPIANDKPYWNGENFPVSKGVFYMTAPNCPGVQLIQNKCTYVRIGDLCRFNIEYIFGMAQGDAPTGKLLLLQGLPFISQDISLGVVECRTDQLRLGKLGGVKALVAPGAAEIFFVIEEANGETTNILTDAIKPTTYGVYQSFNITGTYKVG